MATLLLVDDDRDLAQTLARVLESKGHKALTAHTAKDALEILRRESIGLLLLDLHLGEADGLDVLAKAREEDPDLPVIILTGDTDVPTAVKAMRLGARDYLTKPCRNDELVLVVERALKERAMEREVEVLRDRLHREAGPEALVGRSASILHVLDDATRIAATDLTVVIQGESGTGKELLARRIHALSARRDGIFVAVDCGTLPEALAESELFGHEKGAFTGAAARRLGVFEEAAAGTLFLDEIVNLSSALQAKFLRAIQERRIRRVGGTKDLPVDVRILVASNVDLLDAVRQGKFREDLFHRLNQYAITVPPLRERLDDIEPLAAHFLEEANRMLHKQVRGFRPSALEALRRYRFPGNVRELRNIVTRAAHLAEERIDAEHFILEPTHPQSPNARLGAPAIKIAAKSAAAEAEKRMIADALAANAGNKVRTARALGINRMTLYLKIKKYGLYTH